MPTHLPTHLPTEPRIYLASRSPRRQELLRQIGVGFDELRLREAPGRDPDIVEGPRDGESAPDYVKRIARTKANVGWERMTERGLPPRPVLGADTEVVLDGHIFGKPADSPHALEMLARLAGRTHVVMTAVALRWEREFVILMSTSQVTMRELTADEMARYVATGEPVGKAGAYAIQGMAAAFITRIDGSYSGVMGLPLAETAAALGKIGRAVL
jgi:septum formation protein